MVIAKIYLTNMMNVEKKIKKLNKEYFIYLELSKLSFIPEYNYYEHTVISN